MPKTVIIKRKGPVRCAGCGHPIRSGTPAVREECFEIIAGRAKVYLYHYDPVCLNRAAVDAFEGDPR